MLPAKTIVFVMKEFVIALPVTQEPFVKLLTLA